MVLRLMLIVLALPLLSAAAWAMPRGTVIIRGLNKELNSVEWEVKGKQVKVKTRKGIRWFDLDEVELIPDVDHVDRDAPPALSAAEHAKLLRRLTLVPPSGWEPVGYQQPLLAEAYKHPSKKVYLELWITPEGDYEFASEEGRVKAANVTAAASKGLLLRYATAQRANFTWVEFGGKVLLQGKCVVEAFGAEGSWEINEYRLRDRGLEYAIVVRMGTKEKIDTSPEELLTHFSFLEPVSESTERYVDHELGFYALAPKGPWSLLARPFSREQPLRAVRGSGEGEVVVEVLAAGTAQGVADQIVSEHKKQNSGFLDVKTVERFTRDGQEVVFYRLDDYPIGRRVLHAFQGLVIRTAGDKLLHFRGMADATDEAPAKELRLLLDGVRFLGSAESSIAVDLEAAKSASEAQECMKGKDYSGAIRALDRCLDACPSYVPAILFRAEAKKASGDFSGFREDIALAQEFDPSVEGASGPEAYAEEAKAAESARDWGQACRSWATAWEKDPSSSYLKSYARALNSYWTDLKRSKDGSVEGKVRQLESAADAGKREDEVKKVLAIVYTTAANDYKKEKNYSKAFRFASKLKGLRGDYRAKAEVLRTQIKTAKDRDKR